MQRAYLEKDTSYDGLFFLGVRTTGIFCKPTCPARKPLPQNVEYFATAQHALVAGYRPCRRCRPLGMEEHPSWVVELMNDIDRMDIKRISDAELRGRGVDPATARRYFQKRFGMTFQAFCRARRLTQALGQIRKGAPLDNVVFENGYESHSGFRDAFVRLFGKPPGHCRAQDSISLTWIKSPLGPLVAGATREGICLLEFTDRRMLEAQFAAISRLFQCAVLPGKTAHLTLLEQELTGYFAGAVQSFSVPLVYPGSDFQRRVWKELLNIPYGETRSYEDIAVAVGTPAACRAVGRTNGLNRIAIVIPCHRVVNKGGQLGGYGGGLRRKQFLLELEKANKREGVEKPF